MGFHCGNTASGKLSFCEMKYQMIMARSLPVEVTNGTLEGDIAPGDITFYRLQSTSDNKIRAYVAQGEVLPVATRSFGSIGVFAIPEMGRFYRHVLIEKNYPHHGAVAFGHFGKALFEVFKYIGVPVEEIVRGIKSGVRKVNVDTDCRMAITGAIRKLFAENPKEFDPRKYLKPAIEEMQKVCEARYIAFGAAGHADKIKVVPMSVMAKRYAAGEI